MTSFSVLEICRHRMATDGPGISTLIALAGCPASCPYCLNKQVLKEKRARLMTAEQLLEEVAVDTCYMMVTGGGVVFGGGEPLLQADALLDFAQKKPSWMKLSIETSLQVPEQAVQLLLPYVDLWIADFKAGDPAVYHAYTGLTREKPDRNLELLKSSGPEKCLIRVPDIEGYVAPSAADASAAKLREAGFSRIDRFSYRV